MLCCSLRNGTHINEHTPCVSVEQFVQCSLVARMRLVLLVVTMFASIPDFIKVRNFSLITEKGENVLQPGFDRRRLRDSIASQRLTLKLNALEKNFVFHLQKSHPIFAPDATIKLSGRVRLHGMR